MSHDPRLHAFVQVSDNARRDLKEGLVLYTTDNNAGLKDAWNTIQGEVRDRFPWKRPEFFEIAVSVPPLPPSVAMLRRDGPPRLVRRAARQRGSRPLLSALLPGLRPQRLQHLLDPGQLADQSKDREVDACVTSAYLVDC